MTLYIIFVLVLFVIQTLMPASIRYLFGNDQRFSRLKIALGPRDQQPEMPLVGQRAERALANMQEALPVFLTIALLHVIKNTNDSEATRGALVFLVARIVYVPAYLSGIPWFRSIVWMVSWIGLGFMIFAFYL